MLVECVKSACRVFIECVMSVCRVCVECVECVWGVCVCRVYACVESVFVEGVCV